MGHQSMQCIYPVIVGFFLHLRQHLGFSVTAVKGYRAVLLHVFTLTGIDLATRSVVSRMFHLFGRSCPPREFRPPAGTSLSFSFVCRCHLLSPSSWPWTNISPGRHPFYLLLCQPKGLVSCMASPSGLVICVVGGPALFHSFLTS